MLQAIRDLGYRPSEVARSLSSRRTYTVGVIVYDLLNPGLAAIVNSVQVGLAREGYRTIVACMAGQFAAGESCLSLIEDRRVDGIIITNPLPDADADAPGAAMLPELARTGTICYHPSSRRVSRAKFDNLAGGEQAMTHLLSLGHRRIGVLVGPERWGIVDERLTGVHVARDQRGLP
ncbi:MAG TPA: LacI family DNA-binding transcriptional regulator, partial [Chloroflexota bacterium]|nr:LacI family DNA-binding transcriptional regulator [Chloroflexota bacterium]